MNEKQLYEECLKIIEKEEEFSLEENMAPISLMEALDYFNIIQLPSNIQEAVKLVQKCCDKKSLFHPELYKKTLFVKEVLLIYLKKKDSMDCIINKKVLNLKEESKKLQEEKEKMINLPCEREEIKTRIVKLQEEKEKQKERIKIVEKKINDFNDKKNSLNDKKEELENLLKLLTKEEKNIRIREKLLIILKKVDKILNIIIIILIFFLIGIFIII